MYSSEYEQYKARQSLYGQSFQSDDLKKNDLYTLTIAYDHETRDIREDIMALISEINFKSTIKEYYKKISFHEIFSIARTIVSNTRDPLNTYSVEERELIIRTVIAHRIQSAKKQLV